MKGCLLAFSMLLVTFPCAGICGEPEVRVDLVKPVDPSQKNFQNELSILARRSVELGKKRFSKIKDINDSYQLTAEAIRILAESGDVVKAIQLLRQATKKYDGNRTAYLLQGWVFERMSDRADAARAYDEFYRHSLTLVPFEKELIGPSSLRVFNAYIEKRFAEWGFKLSKPKVSFELQKARSVVMLERSPVGQWINLTLPLFVLIGFVLMLLARMRGVDFSPGVLYFLLGGYLLIITGYLFWAAHFFMGLPFLVSIEFENGFLFGGGLVLIVVFYAVNRLIDRRRGPGADSKVCPHCRAIILKISTECPFCKRPSGS